VPNIEQWQIQRMLGQVLPSLSVLVVTALSNLPGNLLKTTIAHSIEPLSSQSFFPTTWMRKATLKLYWSLSSCKHNLWSMQQGNSTDWYVKYCESQETNLKFVSCQMDHIIWSLCVPKGCEKAACDNFLYEMGWTVIQHLK